MQGFNEKGIKDLTNLVGTLGDVQQQAKAAINGLITPDIEAQMTEGQKIMMNDLKGAIDLDGCKDLSSKLEEIQGALKKHNI